MAREAAAKPKILSRVIEAIARLAERNGSSTKNIVNYVLESSKPDAARNLTVQVKQALRLAVTSGQVRLRGGRFKLRLAEPTEAPEAAAPAAASEPPPAKTSKSKKTSSSLPSAEDKRKSREARRRSRRGKAKSRGKDNSSPSTVKKASSVAASTTATSAATAAAVRPGSKATKTSKKK